MLGPLYMTDPVYDMSVKDVLKLTQCHRATLYRWVKAGIFPKPKRIGTGRNGRVRWSSLEIANWARGDD